MRNFLGILFFLFLFSCCRSGDRDYVGDMPRPVGVEHLEPSGLLAEWIGKNFDRLEEEYYRPAQVYWTEEQSNGWPGDKEGRTILALTLLSRASKERRALYLDSLIAMLPHHLNTKGYLGSIHEDFIDEQQISGHGWLLRGLCEYYEDTHNDCVLGIASRIVDNLFLPMASKVETYPLNPESRRCGVGDMSGTTQNTVGGWRLSSDVGCVFIGMEGLIHYHTLRPSAETAELIDRLVNLFKKIDLTGINAQTHATLTAMRGLLRLAAFNGDRSLVDAVEDRWKIYKESGMTEDYENYNWFGRTDTWTEPCAIVDSYMVAMQLWQATGKPEYLDDADRILHNGIAATFRVNGGFGCNKPLGPDYDSLTRHCDEAYWCCTMRGGEGLAKALEYSCFESGDTIFLTQLLPLKVTLPERGLTVELESEYPNPGTISCTATNSGGRSVSIALRNPKWDESGQTVENSHRSGFDTFTVNKRKTERHTITYAPQMKWVPAINSSLKETEKGRWMRGPLVMADSVTRSVVCDSLTRPKKPIHL